MSDTPVDLVAKAQSQPVRTHTIRNLTPETIQLVHAYLRGKITLSQAERALFGQTGGGKFYVIVARVTKHLCNLGILQVPEDLTPPTWEITNGHSSQT